MADADSRALYAYRAAAGAVGERAMEEHLARSIGLVWAPRTDGKGRDIVGIAPEVSDLFSSRPRAVTAKTRDLVGASRPRSATPRSPFELDRLQRTATFATRCAKTHHEANRPAFRNPFRSCQRPAAASRDCLSCGGRSHNAVAVLQSASRQSKPT